MGVPAGRGKGTGNSTGNGPGKGFAPRRRREQVRGGGFDLLAIGAALTLVGLGVANLYAVEGPALAMRQAGVAVLGMALLAVFWRFRVRFLTTLGWICYGGAVIFLVAVMVFGITANGATRWISVGPLTFQPSELGKLGLLLVLAWVLGSTRPGWQRFTLALLLALVPLVLTVTQPDLSTTLLLTVLTVAMLIMGRIPGRFLLPLLGIAIISAPLAVGLLRPYQVERLGSFLVGSHQAPSGAGWTVQQARISLGSTGIFGPGHELNDLLAQYLPERDTDLAVASVTGQFGLAAGAAVVVAALVLVWRLALASRATRTAHGALLAGGLAVLFGLETVVSLGGNLGLLPLAGVPFPLLSYGGTALVVHLAALGVVLGVRRDGVRRRMWAPPRWRAQRPRLVRLAAVAISVVLVSFGTYGWQVWAVEGPELTEAGVDQMTRCTRIPAPRGLITDRHGTVLAGNVEEGRVQVLAVPALARANPDNVARLAELTGQPVDTLRANLDAAPATTLSLPVAEVPKEVGAAITEAQLSGVIITPVVRRTYPAGPMLGPLLGYTGPVTQAELRRWPDLRLTETVGRAGLERQYDAVLRGIDGRQCVYVNPPGVPVAMGEYTPPVPGANLRTSLDLGLQRVLTDGLAAQLRGQFRGAIGGAVAMDPKSGQILALASVPGYDNNVYGPPVDTQALAELAKAPGSPLRHHAIQSPVPPGSTFKLVVATADIVHPVLPPNRVIPTGASFTYGNHTFNNWRGMGPMDMVQSIAWSNDVYFYKLAVMLGPEAMINTARTLGVGAPTGIDLPGESGGYLGTPESVKAKGGTWYPGSTVILGIGQGYLTTTPLQAAVWTAAVSTGTVVTPRVGLASGTDEANYTALPEPKRTTLPFAEALGPVKAGMRAAVTGGTATRLAGLPVPVGAKTGTAQDGALPDGLYDNWMSAAAPIDDPNIVITTMVQGSNNAGVVAHDGLAYYFAHQAEVLATPPLQRP